MTANIVVSAEIPGPLWLWYGALLAFMGIHAVNVGVSLAERYYLWRLRRRRERLAIRP